MSVRPGPAPGCTKIATRRTKIDVRLPTLQRLRYAIDNPGLSTQILGRASRVGLVTKRAHGLGIVVEAAPRVRFGLEPAARVGPGVEPTICQHPQWFAPNMSDTFWPPKPNELDIANDIPTSRAMLGTTSNGIAGSGL